MTSKRVASVVAVTILIALMIAYWLREPSSSRLSKQDRNIRGSAAGDPASDVSANDLLKRQKSVKPKMMDVLTALVGLKTESMDAAELWTLETEHPGFGDAYQAASFASGGRTLLRCTEAARASQVEDRLPREYDYTVTLLNDGKGHLVMSDVDVTPVDTADAPAYAGNPEFYECLRNRRAHAGLSIPITPTMKLGSRVMITERGRSGNADLTPTLILATIADAEEQLASMNDTDPTKTFIAEIAKLYRCYQSDPFNVEHRIECLHQVLPE